jgi:adenine-specific DNA-methyltransferase
MPTHDFKGKQFVYAHHLTAPFRPLVPDLKKSVLPKGQGADLAGVNEQAKVTH